MTASPDDQLGPAPGPPTMRAFIDLHCHTRGSFDSLADPSRVVRAAALRGLTHLAITDHDRIEAALEGQAHAPEGLHVIVGEEILTTAGDLIGVFLTRPVPRGLSPAEAIAAVREQGGLVGIPHPFDRFRSSLARDDPLDGLAGLVDWVEGFNARLIGAGNERAAEFAHEHEVPAVAASDAHTVMEVGVAYTIVEGDPSTADGLRAALATAEMMTARASYLVRGVTPVATVVQRLRGRGRRSGPATSSGHGAVR